MVSEMDSISFLLFDKVSSDRADLVKLVVL